MAQEYRLTTPEAIDLRYQVAGIGTRFLAAMVDALVVAGLLIIVLLGCLALGTGVGGALGSGLTSLAEILASTLSVLIVWGYYVFFETVWGGQTPGKQLLHLRVIKTSGYPVGFVDAFIRNLVRWADFLPGFYGIGVICMFISPQSRRLGDYAAGTIVVKERPPVTLADLTGAAQRGVPSDRLPALGEVDPDELAWDLGALSSRDLLLAAEYLERAPQLRPEVRRRIGDEIAGRLARRVGAREPLDGERFIERLVGLWRSQGQV